MKRTLSELLIFVELLKKINRTVTKLLFLVQSFVDLFSRARKVLINSLLKHVYDFGAHFLILAPAAFFLALPN